MVSFSFISESSLCTSPFTITTSWRQKKERGDPHKSPTRQKIQNNVDFISLNMNSSREEALLYIFEDNEAVIKMIIKGRSHTMRHVFRTHRVALDWLFDRINLDPKIQIKYIDTKNQLADILTEEISHVTSGIIC